jgi:hypothetical protein
MISAVMIIPITLINHESVYMNWNITLCPQNINSYYVQLKTIFLNGLQRKEYFSLSIIP